MEEKKVCPECENTEQKLEELTQEEAQQVAGGKVKTNHHTLFTNCKVCGARIYNNSKYCNACGTEQ